MRLLTLALLLVLPLDARAAGSVLAPSVDPNATCRICHGDVVKLRGAPGPHADEDCVDCHEGYEFNPHVVPDWGEERSLAVQALAPFARHSPEALGACADCHDDVFEVWRSSVHGGKTETDDRHRTARCEDCHGNVHAVPEKMPSKLVMAQRCIECHGFAEEGHPALSPYVVDTYRDTIHGKMLHLGNEDAAFCVDCHGGHAIFGKNDPRSSVHGDNRVDTCAKCHEGATAWFSNSISHRPHKLNYNFWAGFTSVAFSVLTAGTIFLLFLHVVLDFFRTGTIALARRRKPEPRVAEGPVGAEDPVPRFDIHMRMQHWMLMASFTTLVITGWPLKSASVGQSSRMVEVLGGQAALAMVHRVAGALLLVTAAYHLAWLISMYRGRRLSWEMVPGLNDARHLWQNLMFFLGLREERPKFGRWTYYEKFDYWAVFWGMVVMGGSGLLLWFPEFSSHFLPGEVFAIALIAHSDEALLALLAIFLWHFYNVHLKPSIFPMSHVFLSGKITAEALWTEHRAEYERLYGHAPPRSPDEEPAWHRSSIWSFAAVGIIVLAGLLVVVGNVSNVRDQIAGLGKHGSALVAVAEAKPKEILGVFDEGFSTTETCFECHNEARFKADEGNFRHVYHFEEEDLPRDCGSCHVMRWHRSLTLETESCWECHEPDEIGFLSEKPGEVVGQTKAAAGH